MSTDKAAMAASVNELVSITFSNHAFADKRFRGINAVFNIEFATLSDQFFDVFHAISY